MYVIVQTTELSWMLWIRDKRSQYCRKSNQEPPVFWPVRSGSYPVL